MATTNGKSLRLPIYCEAVANIEDIIYEGSEDEYYESSVARRRSYENAGQRFLQQGHLSLVTSTLRGPFDAEYGWSNPWRSRKQLAQERVSDITPRPSAAREACGKKRRPDNSECHLPSPESLPKASAAKSHNFLQENEMDVIQWWRHDIGETDGSCGSVKKRRAKGSEWLKRRDGKRQRLSIPNAQTKSPARRQGARAKSILKARDSKSPLLRTPAPTKSPPTVKSASQPKHKIRGKETDTCDDELISALDTPVRSASQRWVSPMRRVSPITKFSRSGPTYTINDESEDELTSTQTTTRTLPSPMSQGVTEVVEVGCRTPESRTSDCFGTVIVTPNHREARNTRNREQEPAVAATISPTQIRQMQSIVKPPDADASVLHDMDDAISSSSLSSLSGRSTPSFVDFGKAWPPGSPYNVSEETNKNQSDIDEHLSISSPPSSIEERYSQPAGDLLHESSIRLQGDRSLVSWQDDAVDHAASSSLISGEERSSEITNNLNTTSPIGLMISSGLREQEMHLAGMIEGTPIDPSTVQNKAQGAEDDGSKHGDEVSYTDSPISADAEPSHLCNDTSTTGSPSIFAGENHQQDIVGKTNQLHVADRVSSPLVTLNGHLSQNSGPGFSNDEPEVEDSSMTSKLGKLPEEDEPHVKAEFIKEGFASLSNFDSIGPALSGPATDPDESGKFETEPPSDTAKQVSRGLDPKGLRQSVPKSPQRIMSEPDLHIIPFAFFMSPSPVKRRSRRNLALHESACQPDSLSAATETPTSKIKKTVTWAALPEYIAERSPANKTQTFHAASPPPETPIEESPTAQAHNFGKHFSIMANRSETTRQDYPSLRDQAVNSDRVSDVVTVPEGSITSSHHASPDIVQPASDSIAGTLDGMKDFFNI